MFVGHYAAALALSSSRPERGALTYISLSSVMPDLFMLSAGILGSKLNYHADLGFLLCMTVVILIGFLFRVQLSLLGLAISALILHLPLDFLYMSQDSANLYNYPLMDFFIEATLLTAASAYYIHKRGRSKKHKKWFIATIVMIVGLQGLWNFGFSIISREG